MCIVYMNKTNNKRYIRRKNNRKTKKQRKRQSIKKARVVSGGSINDNIVLKKIVALITQVKLTKQEKWPLENLFYTIKIYLLKDLKEKLSCNSSVFSRVLGRRMLKDNTMLCNDIHITREKLKEKVKSSKIPGFYVKLLVHTKILQKLFRICLFLRSEGKQNPKFKAIGEFILNTFFKYSEVDEQKQIESLNAVLSVMTETDWKTFIQYIYDNLDQILTKPYTYDDYTLLMVDNSQKIPDDHNDDIGLDTDYISQIPENLLSVLIFFIILCHFKMILTTLQCHLLINCF